MSLTYSLSLGIRVYLVDSKMHARAQTGGLVEEVPHISLENDVVEKMSKKKSKLEVSNGNWKFKLQQFCREEGIGMDGSIEFLGIYKRTCLNNWARRRTAED